MSKPSNPNDASPPRPWRRPHRSTYVVLAGLLVALFLANVPGQIVRSPSLSEGWHEGFVFMLEDELQHGWPATYLWREPSGLPIPWGMPPAGWQSLWPLSENVKRWNLASLAIDVCVGLAVLALGGAGYEAWRRRRVRLWQFRLRDLLALVAVASLVLGYWKIHADEYRSQHDALVAIQGRSYENDWQPGGPSWLRLLLVDRRFHILDRVVDITVHTDEPGRLQHLARLRMALPPVRIVLTARRRCREWALVAWGGVTEERQRQQETVRDAAQSGIATRRRGRRTGVGTTVGRRQAEGSFRIEARGRLPQVTRGGHAGGRRGPRPAAWSTTRSDRGGV